MPGTSLRLSLDLTETIQANLYYRNAFQPEVQLWAKHYLDTSRIFVDAGANIGIHALYAADYYRQKQGTVRRPMIYAFEPNPGIYSKLQRNIQLNGLESLVTAHPFAVAEREGWTSFYLSDEDNSTSSSLAFLGPAHFQRGEKVNVRTISLSSFLAEQANQNGVGLIKLDIAGAELLALRGARPLLSEHHPALIVEIYPALMRAFRHTFSDLAQFLTRWTMPSPEFGPMASWCPYRTTSGRTMSLAAMSFVFRAIPVDAQPVVKSTRGGEVRSQGSCPVTSPPTMS